LPVQGIFFQQVIHGPPAGALRRAIVVYVEPAKRLTFSPGKAQCPIGKNAFHINEVLQDVFDRPFTWSVTMIVLFSRNIAEKFDGFLSGLV